MRPITRWQIAYINETTHANDHEWMNTWRQQDWTLTRGHGTYFLQSSKRSVDHRIAEPGSKQLMPWLNAVMGSERTAVVSWPVAQYIVYGLYIVQSLHPLHPQLSIGAHGNNFSPCDSAAMIRRHASFDVANECERVLSTTTQPISTRLLTSDAVYSRTRGLPCVCMGWSFQWNVGPRSRQLNDGRWKWFTLGGVPKPFRARNYDSDSRTLNRSACAARRDKSVFMWQTSICRCYEMCCIHRRAFPLRPNVSLLVWPSQR